MKPVWLYGVCTLALWGTLGGCKSEEEGPTRSESVEIFSWWTQGSDKQALDQLIAAHEEEFSKVDVVNAALEAEKDGNDARSELVARMDGGDPPDAFQQTGVLADWLTRGSGIEPLDELAASKGWDTAFYNFLLSGLKVSDQLYAVPTSVYGQNYLYYNKAVFTQAKLTPPTNITELLDACETLKAANITPMGMSYQGSVLRIAFDAVAVATAATTGDGGVFLKNLYAGLIDGANLQQAVYNLDDLVKKYSNPADVSSVDLGWQTLGERLASGQVAMVIQGGWLKRFLDGQGKTAGTDYDVVVFPGSGATFLFNADSFSLPAGAENTEGAEDFLSTFLDAGVQVSLAQTRGACPSIRGADLSSLDVVSRSMCRPMISATTGLLVQEKLDSVLQDAYVTGKTAAEIRDAISAAYNFAL